MTFGFFNNNKSIAKQAASIKIKYKQFEVSLTRNTLKAVGEIQPTARSEKYKIEVRYSFKKQPEVRVLKPDLSLNFNGDKIPHIYPGKILCLHQPKYREFTYSDYLSETIIPWTSLWLYHYEIWQVTGEWYGGGEHPV